MDQGTRQPRSRYSAPRFPRPGLPGSRPSPRRGGARRRRPPPAAAIKYYAGVASNLAGTGGLRDFLLAAEGLRAAAGDDPRSRPRNAAAAGLRQTPDFLDLKPPRPEAPTAAQLPLHPRRLDPKLRLKS